MKESEKVLPPAGKCSVAPVCACEMFCGRSLMVGCRTDHRLLTCSVFVNSAHFSTFTLGHVPGGPFGIAAADFYGHRPFLLPSQHLSGTKRQGYTGNCNICHFL